MLEMVGASVDSFAAAGDKWMAAEHVGTDIWMTVVGMALVPGPGDGAGKRVAEDDCRWEN
jgi:hypothetical protein